MAKKKLPRLMTPKCTILFARILGESDSKYRKDGGEWSVKALLESSNPEHVKFMAQLDTLAAEAVETMKVEKDKKKIAQVTPYQELIDKTTEEPVPGKYTITFKMPHKVTAKNGPNAGNVYEFRPFVCDAAGNPIKGAPRIAAGTTGKIVFEHEPYYVEKDKEAGLRRRLAAVQIIKLVEWNGQSASAFGFEEEENDSFESQVEETSAPAAAPSAETGSDF